MTGIRTERRQWAKSPLTVFRGGLRAALVAESGSATDLAIALLMTLTVGIGALIRLWQLNRLGFNSDEAVYVGQAAAIAGDPTLKNLFPIFRAHPMLYQVLMSTLYPFSHFVALDVLERLLAVFVGLLLIVLTYKTGNLVYGRRTGVIAALFIAVMPYEVIVSRQVLLDGPMTLCATLTLYLLARFSLTHRVVWLYAAGAAMGLTVDVKETGIILLAAVFAFLALSPEVRIRGREIGIALLCFVLAVLPYPITVLFAGGGGSGRARQYFLWQVFRQPNHDYTFYFTTFFSAVGPLVLLSAILGFVMLRHEWTWREKLMVSWILAPFLFFEVWPVKGFQYLLPAAPPVAILAARPIARWSPTASAARWQSRASWLRLVAMGIIAASLVYPSVLVLQDNGSSTYTAGAGGVPGGREVGQWIQQHTPANAQFMTIGPSMANIIQYYGHRQARGVSVSTNPQNRNPSYNPIYNPDLLFRNGEIQYIVWDSFSADRSGHFTKKIYTFIKRYHGFVVHTEYLTVSTPSSAQAVKPIIIIYQVRP